MNTSSTTTHAASLTVTHRYLITLTVMLVTVLEVLDMTIVNVSLPAMMGSLGCNSEQITWVLTSYIVAAAIFMPLTGFLVNRVGRKRLLIANILGFMVSSAFCGIASSLTQIVIFRTLQGVFGASLVPLSQYILRDSFPPEEHGKAMAIWGIGIMTAPVLGPALGGYITENFSWRWLFYINVPVCIAAWLLSLYCVQETKTKKEYIDWLGMVLMGVGVGCLQIFLDKGNSNDWFDSHLIISLGMIWVLALGIFIVRGMYYQKNIINLNLFRDRNFSFSMILITCFCGGLLGVITLQPLLLERVMGYPTMTAGLLMAPRGIASAFAMMFVGIMMKYWSSRMFIAVGIILASIGSYLMGLFQLHTPAETIVWVGVLQGIGIGFFFVPLSTIAFASLPESSTAEASGLFSFGRSIGSSIGISLISTFITRQTQSNWHQFSSSITPFNPNLQQWLADHHWTLQTPEALQTIVKHIANKASISAFDNAFVLIALLSFLLLFFTAKLDKDDGTQAAGMMH